MLIVLKCPIKQILNLERKSSIIFTDSRDKYRYIFPKQNLHKKVNKIQYCIG